MSFLNESGFWTSGTWIPTIFENYLMYDSNKSIVGSSKWIWRSWAEHRTHVHQGQKWNTLHDNKMPKTPDPERIKDPAKVQSLFVFGNSNKTWFQITDKQTDEQSSIMQWWVNRQIISKFILRNHAPGNANLVSNWLVSNSFF